jgi:hypothetical protein
MDKTKIDVTRAGGARIGDNTTLDDMRIDGTVIG